MTAHINAKKDQVAKIVLMAGDPLRVKKFVEENLKNYELVNTVRNEWGYTGYLNDKRVSVFSHGMGLDSSGIYAFELFSFYEVDYIIRFGSAGSYNPNFNLGDVVIAKEAYNPSGYGLAYNYEFDTINPSEKLLSIARESVEKDFNSSKNFKETKIHSSHWFYTKPNFYDNQKMVEMGIDAVEMEAYGIYAIAKYFNKDALAILTISDSLVTEEEMSSEQRVNAFENMFKLLIKIVENL